MGSFNPQDRLPLEGKYANFFKVGYNDYEIVIEFGQLYGSEGEPRIHSRIITSAAYALELIKTLKLTLYKKDQSE